MVDEHKGRTGRKAGDPLFQPGAVGVAGKPGHLPDLGVDLHILAKQPHLVGALQQGASQRAGGLVAHKQDGAFLTPEVVLEVVADAASIAHARRRDDDLGGGVGIDGNGVLLGLADAQSGEGQRVLPGADQGQGVLVIALAVIFAENGGGAVGQRTVHIDGEPVVAVDAALGLDLPD